MTTEHVLLHMYASVSAWVRQVPTPERHLRDKALEIFFEQVERSEIVLQVIDKSELNGAIFLADFSGLFFV